MNHPATIASFFLPTSMIPGEVMLYIRQDTHPVPFCITLINLSELDKQREGVQLPELFLSHLSHEEKNLFKDFSYPKRKREWLGGRLAAKYGVLTILDRNQSTDNIADLSVLPQENGSPTLHSSRFPKEKLPSLSISHSENFAVAMAAEAKSCGIDIQKISDKTQRVADRFCDEEELMLLQKCVPLLTEIERLTLLWSAKEALKKSLLHDQPVIFQGVVLQSLDISQFYSLYLHLPGTLEHPAEVTAVILEDYVLAYTIAAGSSNA